MRTSIHRLQEKARTGEKLAVLTCYDASFAHWMEAQGVDILLVGDSLGMVVQGHETTLPVTLDEMIYHTRAVTRGSQQVFIIADMPFGSSQISPPKTFANAARLLQAGAQMVKLEGGNEMAETVAFLTQRGIPVCGHLGLTPQSVHQLGGYKVQGRDQSAQDKLLADALALQAAGASLLVLEAMPVDLARRITQALQIPTIGIGAGPACCGQVLVLHDLLGITLGRKPRFAQDFLAESGSIPAAISAFVNAVKSGAFPAPEHCFQ